MKDTGHQFKYFRNLPILRSLFNPGQKIYIKFSSGEKRI